MGGGPRPKGVCRSVGGTGALICAGRASGAIWAKGTEKYGRGAGARSRLRSMRCASRGRFRAMTLGGVRSKSTAYHCLQCSLFVPTMTDLMQIPDHTLWLEYTCGNVVPVRVAAAMEKNLHTVAQVKRAARCAQCGARVKSDAYGLRIAWSLAKDRQD